MSTFLDNLYEQMSELHSSQIGSLCAQKITPEHYINDPKGIQQFFEDAIAEIELFDDFSTSDVYEVLRTAYIVSDFKFEYRLGFYRPSFKLFTRHDSQELKGKFLDLVNATQLRQDLGYWPGYNAANLSEDDAQAVSVVYHKLTDYPWSSEPLGSTVFDQTFGMLGYLLKNAISDEQRTQLKITALPLLGYPYLTDYHKILYDIGNELYGNKFNTLFTLAKSLDLASNKIFWQSHLVHDITSNIQCPNF